MAIPRLKSLRRTGYNTSNIAGLTQLADDSGFGQQAQKINQRIGESPKEIFSGGFVSDIFDVLNTLQYGVVGVLKGKGFKEGVRSRESFSDEDALGDNGIPGVIAGIAMDILVDPLTYIPPIAILKRVPGLAKIAKAAKVGIFGKRVEKTFETAKGIKKVQTLQGGTKTGKYLARKLTWIGGADPMYKEAWERMEIGKQTGMNNIQKVFKPFSEMSGEAREQLLTRSAVKGREARLIRKPIEQVFKEAGEETGRTVKGVWDNIDGLIDEQAKLGLIPKEWATNKELWIKNAYKEFEKPKGISGFFRKTFGVKGQTKKAKLLGKETLPARKALGEIKDPIYPLYKSAIQMVNDIEAVKMNNLIAKNYALDAAQAGFKQLSKSRRFLTSAGVEAVENGKLGKLSGKFVPDWMHEIIEDTVRVAKPGEQTSKKLWAGFKYGKVILNPAAHVRNPISNTLLNWWKLGIGPWRVDKYAGAVKEFATDGSMWQRAKKVGAGMSGMASNEITDILFSPDGMIAGKKFGKQWKKIAQAPAKMYQAEESIAKLTAFTHFVKKGLTDADAWRKAESATFNYAQVSPFVRKLRESVFGVPFVTFGIKAAPLAVETALKHPGRISVFGKAKKAIENATDQDELFKERANEPDWVKDGFYIKLPMKDKNGRSAYFDLTYIIPFGDLASGQMFQRAVRRDTQLPESAVSTVLSKNPTINFIKEISRNEDFFGNQIWKKSDDSFKQTQDLMRHLLKSYSPQPLSDQIPAGYDFKGERIQSGLRKAAGATADNQKRSIGQEILKNAGIKIQPMVAEQQETFKNWNNKKALETLLKENGVLTGYEINYLKK